MDAAPLRSGSRIRENPNAIREGIRIFTNSATRHRCGLTLCFDLHAASELAADQKLSRRLARRANRRNSCCHENRRIPSAELDHHVLKIWIDRPKEGDPTCRKVLAMHFAKLLGGRQSAAGIGSEQLRRRIRIALGAAALRGAGSRGAPHHLLQGLQQDGIGLPGVGSWHGNRPPAVPVGWVAALALGVKTAQTYCAIGAQSNLPAVSSPSEAAAQIVNIRNKRPVQ